MGYIYPMERKRICFLDIETSGLKPEVHEILEVCAVLYTFEPSLTWKETIQSEDRIVNKIMPLKEIDPFIIRLINYDAYIWKKTAINLHEAMARIIPLMENSIIIGSKPSFDLSFIEKAIGDLNWNMPRMASHHPIDLTSAFSKLWFEGKVSKLRQNDVVKFFHPDHEQPHSASGDVDQLILLLENL